jgi:hypothetical protein
MEQKAATTAAKIRPLIYGLFGIAFFCQGTTYFQEQYSYSLPRMLYPVLLLLGNKGLAVGMLLLGALLIYLGYFLWKKTAWNPSIYKTGAAVGLAAGIMIAFATNKPRIDTDQLARNMRAAERNYRRTAAAAGNSNNTSNNNNNVASPKNMAMEVHFKQFQTLLIFRQAYLNTQNRAAIAQSDADFATWQHKADSMIAHLADNSTQAVYNKQLAEAKATWAQTK